MSVNNKPRPHLVINEIHRPVEGVKTHIKGWGNNPNNWSVEERVSVVDRLTKRVLETASVIIDVEHRKVVKLRTGSQGDHENVLTHFLGKYAAEVQQGREAFVAKAIRAHYNQTPRIKPLMAAEVAPEAAAASVDSEIQAVSSAVQAVEGVVHDVENDTAGVVALGEGVATDVAVLEGDVAVVEGDPSALEGAVSVSVKGD